MTSKQERIIALRDSIHSQISYGDGMGDAIKTIVDGFTNMLLVLAEDDHDAIAERMLYRFMGTRLTSILPENWREEQTRQIAKDMWDGQLPSTM